MCLRCCCCEGSIEHAEYSHDLSFEANTFSFRCWHVFCVAWLEDLPTGKDTSSPVLGIDA